MVVLGSGLRLVGGGDKWELPGEQRVRGVHICTGDGAQSAWYCMCARVHRLGSVHRCKRVWKVGVVHQGPGALTPSYVFSHLCLGIPIPRHL